MQIYKILSTCLLTTLTSYSLAGESIKQSLPLNNATTVSIDSMRGEVRIEGTKGNTVDVSGELDDQAEKFIFEQNGAHIRIKVVMPRRMKNSWNEKGSNLTIEIPQQVKVNFSSVSSDVEISDFTRQVEVKSVSGQIRASNLSEFIELSSISGDVRANNLSGKIDLATISGDVDDEGSQGRVTLKSVSGDIASKSNASELSINNVSGRSTVSSKQAEDVSVSTVSGDFRGDFKLTDNAVVKMSSVSGDLSLTLNKDVEAAFRLSTNAGGDIINKITSDKATRAKYGPNAKLVFETGSANSTIKATTVSGSIKVQH